MFYEMWWYSITAGKIKTGITLFFNHVVDSSTKGDIMILLKHDINNITKIMQALLFHIAFIKYVKHFFSNILGHSVLYYPIFRFGDKAQVVEGTF